MDRLKMEENKSLGDNSTAEPSVLDKTAGRMDRDPARVAFLTAPLGNLILKNTLPAIASMLFMAFYHIVDAIMVGRSIGPDALASVNILYPIMAFFIGLAAMIGVGGNARVAVLQGSGNTENARRVLGLVVVLGVGLGVAGSLITIFASPSLLVFLGTSGALGEMAGRYLMAIYPFFAMMILIFILEQTVRNDGRPNLATAVMMGMALLNIVLDYFFLFPLQLGIAGAGLATGLSQTMGALIFIGYFAVKKIRNRPGLQVGLPGGGLPVLRIIAFNGSSEFFTSIASGLTTFLFNRALLAYLGGAGVAAFAMAQYLIMFGSVVFIGISVGAQPILSYNHGADRFERVKKTLIYVMVSSWILGVIFFVVLRTQTAEMITLFIPDHPETAALTIRVSSIVSWTLLIMPIGIISSTFFTALERAGSSLLISFSRGFFFTVVGLLVFPSFWGVEGILFTPLFSEAASFLVTVVLLARWAVKCSQ
ncbi:MAG: MATE family efflux transporter [Bacillota bacterium]|nr:MATE family efflux transporter [Bacillota bacterium]